MSNLLKQLKENFARNVILENNLKHLNLYLEHFSKKINLFCNIQTTLTESFDVIDSFKEFLKYEKQLSSLIEEKNIEEIYKILSSKEFRLTIICCSLFFLICLPNSCAELILEGYREDGCYYSYRRFDTINYSINNANLIKTAKLPLFFNYIDKDLINIIRTRLNNDEKDLNNFNFYINNIFKNDLKIWIGSDSKQPVNSDNIKVNIVNYSSSKIGLLFQTGNLYKDKVFKAVSTIYLRDNKLITYVNNFLIKNDLKPIHQ